MAAPASLATTADDVAPPRAPRAPRAPGAPGAPIVATTPTAPARVTATDALLLLMAVLWGVNYIVAKYGTRVFVPLVFNSARIALATVILWAIVLLRGQPLPARRDVLQLLALGVLGNGIYQMLFMEGLARTRASDTALVLASSPAFMAIIGRMRGVERIGRRGAAGIALSLSGIALVVFGARQGAAGASTMTGYAIMIGACVAWSLYVVLLKPLTERIDGITLSAVTITGGLVPMVLVAQGALRATAWAAVSRTAWTAVVYSGVMALVVAYLCWYRGVRVLGPTRASMYANLQPLVAIGVAWAVLGEVPSVVQAAGGVAIMTGLLLTRMAT